MYLYFDSNGVLKETITERQFRAGDSARDKIYAYWEGDHPVLTGWVRYLLPDGSTSEEAEFFDATKDTPDTTVILPLPTNPPRNLRYFDYDHTTNGQLGYPFYEIEVPDDVLASVGDDKQYPAEDNLVVAYVRFVLEDDVIDELGAIPFSVSQSEGILTDAPILQSQYNYLLKLIDATMMANIPDGSITTEKLANYAVTTAKIGSLAVTNGKIANYAVSTDKIADMSVTRDKIGSEAITKSKIKYVGKPLSEFRPTDFSQLLKLLSSFLSSPSMFKIFYLKEQEGSPTDFSTVDFNYNSSNSTLRIAFMNNSVSMDDDASFGLFMRDFGDLIYIQEVSDSNQ